MSPEQPLQSKPLTDQVRELVDRGDVSLPPLPEIGTKLLQMLDEESRASTKTVAELMLHEPAISATVLRMANSAAFGGLQSITDLSQAIARLGLRQAASIVTALVHKGHFEAASPEKERMLRMLWDHAVAAALASRHLAGMSGGDPEESFLAGLLHDVGKLLVLKAIDQLEQGNETVEITPTVQEELITSLHTGLGHSVLLSWKIPEAISKVALRHHEDDLGPDEALVTRVQAADAITRKIGSHPDPDPDLKLSEVEAIELLNIGDFEIAALLVDLEDEIEEVKRLL